MSKRVSNDDIYSFHECGLYIPLRTLYVGSEHSENDDESGTDAAMAARTIKNLCILDSLSDEPITMILNNLGGDVTHGMAIYDAIKACRSHVTIKVFGSCMSMGSVIFQGADSRLMAPNAIQMIHYGHLGVDAHAKTAYKQAEEFKRTDKWMEKLYLRKIKEKHPEYKIGRLQHLLDHDTFLTAEQSLELGLSDGILEES